MKLCLIVSILLLTGCAHVTTESSVDPEQLPHFKTLFPLGNTSHKKHGYKKYCLKKSSQCNQKISRSSNSLTDGFMTFRYDPEKQPIIQTAPFQETVIRLEPGEKFTNISSGDPSRWSYAVAVSGKDENAQQNILVKPSLPNIQTNLVITTDKRLYNLRLVSTQTEQLTRSVSFVYPETEMKTAREDSLIEKTNHPCNNPQFHFHYQIATAGFFGKSPVWQPVRTFDDGTHTYIQFPENIVHRDLPALFVIQNGQKVCVNYRFQSPYMILDQLLGEATLVSGVGSSQQAVIISHRET